MNPLSSTLAHYSREGKGSGRGVVAAAGTCRCLVAWLHPAGPGCIAPHCMQCTATRQRGNDDFFNTPDRAVQSLQPLVFPAFRAGILGKWAEVERKG